MKVSKINKIFSDHSHYIHYIAFYCDLLDFYYYQNIKKKAKKKQREEIFLNINFWIFQIYIEPDSLIYFIDGHILIEVT